MVDGLKTRSTALTPAIVKFADHSLLTGRAHPEGLWLCQVLVEYIPDTISGCHGWLYFFGNDTFWLST